MINSQDKQIVADQKKNYELKVLNYNLDIKCSSYDDSCPFRARCKQGQCECDPPYMASANRSICIDMQLKPIYPGKGQNCTSYCRSSDLYCDFSSNRCECKRSADTVICPLPTNGVFITASQIALSAALLMGIAALAMVIYRLCTKPKFLNARQRADAARATVNRLNNNSNNLNQNGLGRPSVSSIQERVLSRMQDRPPIYGSEIGTHTVAPINRTNGNEIGSEADNPPPYVADNERDMHIYQPPPYTEIVLNPSGYLNQSYVHTENDSTTNINDNNDGNNDREDLKKEKENKSKSKLNIPKTNSKT